MVLTIIRGSTLLPILSGQKHKLIREEREREKERRGGGGVLTIIMCSTLFAYFVFSKI